MSKNIIIYALLFMSVLSVYGFSNHTDENFDYFDDTFAISKTSEKITNEEYDDYSVTRHYQKLNVKTEKYVINTKVANYNVKNFSNDPLIESPQKIDFLIQQKQASIPRSNIEEKGFSWIKFLFNIIITLVLLAVLLYVKDKYNKKENKRININQEIYNYEYKR